MNNISIIEFPSNLGLKEPFPGKEPGVKKLPEHLRMLGFYNLINHNNIQTLYPPPYSRNIDADSGVLNTDALVFYAKGQASLINKVLSEKNFPLVVGGDCSILIGTALALKQNGSYALFYLDGHTDFMEPSMSQTGGTGGMASAIVAGLGPEKLININGMRPYIKEQDVWCVGNREYDEEYENVIKNSQAKYVSLAMIREKGIENIVASFLDMVNYNNLNGFWLHIDVDVLDDNVMPAVDSRTPDGLSYTEFNKILSLLLSSKNISGMEITILDPDLDPSGKYAEEFIHNVANTINNTIKGFNSK